MRHAWATNLLLASFLAWNYEALPDLSMFLIHVRSEGQGYDQVGIMWPVEQPNGSLLLQLDCRTLPLIHAGPWYAVVTAMSRSGDESAYSNELRFYWDRLDGCRDALPETPNPPPPGVSPPLVTPTPPLPPP